MRDLLQFLGSAGALPRVLIVVEETYHLQISSIAFSE